MQKKAERGRRMEKPEKNGSRKTEKRIKAEADEREKEREVELELENSCIDEKLQLEKVNLEWLKIEAFARENLESEARLRED